jgi:pseudouridine kinase
MLKKIMLNSNTPPILCIGASNIDRKLRAVQALHMGSSNPAQLVESHGGVARNVAENLGRLGVGVQLLTAVGHDAAGQTLLAHLHNVGVRTEGSLQIESEATGSYTAVLDAQGELVLAMAHMTLVEQLTPAFIAQTLGLRQGAKLLVMDLNLPADSVAALQKEALQTHATLIAVAVSQPKMARLGKSLAGIDTLILNRAELETLTGHALPLQREVSAAFTALHALGLRRLVVTLGVQGAFFGDSALGHTRVQRVRAPLVAAADVVDVSGAGDAFCAGLCWQLLRQPSDLKTACEKGLQLAALTVQTDATVHPKISAALLQ